MKREWIAPGGIARIQVFPKDISNDPAMLSAFSDQVLTAAPGATGAPIAIRESGRTIVGAFVEAGILSFFAIMVLLVVVLRRAPTWRMTLTPLVLAGFLTLGTCVALDLELELRQHHRPAAAAGHRRRLQYLFRGRLAGGGAEFPAIQPDPRRDLLRPDHRVRLRHLMAVASIPAPPAWANC